MRAAVVRRAGGAGVPAEDEAAAQVVRAMRAVRVAAAGAARVRAARPTGVVG